MSALFSPLKIRGQSFKNRVMVSPMWQYCAEQGFPTDWHLMHLGRFAAGGAGLVFQEGTTIERRCRGTVGDLGIWDDAFIEPLKRLSAIIRSCGAVAGIQLMHPGRKARQKPPHIGRGPDHELPQADENGPWESLGPSAIAVGPGYEVPRAMTLEDIEISLQAWEDAARRAEAAGYDVIELHGAHGYLIHQFLSTASNKREDGYGGDFAGRCRYALEVVQRVRNAWPDHKPLFMRLSCVDGAGWELSDTIRLVPLLHAAGVDVIDCSTGGIDGSPMKGGPMTYCYQAEYARAVRAATGVPTVAVGLIIRPEHAEEIIADGSADFAALARELLYNPNWPVDAAQHLGADPDYQILPDHVGFWLERRTKTVPAVRPSTFSEGAS